jgi:hypothetical protein
MLLGNKFDLEADREVSKEEGACFAQENSMFFYEVSAKSGENIEVAF